jgi:hypothetical protein
VSFLEFSNALLPLLEKVEGQDQHVALLKDATCILEREFRMITAVYDKFHKVPVMGSGCAAPHGRLQALPLVFVDDDIGETPGQSTFSKYAYIKRYCWLAFLLVRSKSGPDVSPVVSQHSLLDGAQVFHEISTAYQLLMCSVLFVLGRAEPALVAEAYAHLAPHVCLDGAFRPIDRRTVCRVLCSRGSNRAVFRPDGV